MARLRRGFGAIDRQIRGLTVIDFGCGGGVQALALAREGAARVIGHDIKPALMVAATNEAVRAGLADQVRFTANPADIPRADLVISQNAFEHFSDPAAILRLWADLLVRGGKVWLTFGPPWYHPHGVHHYFMFRRPWPHVLFSDARLCASGSCTGPMPRARLRKRASIA